MNRTSPLSEFTTISRTVPATGCVVIFSWPSTTPSSASAAGVRTITAAAMRRAFFMAARSHPGAAPTMGSAMRAR
jgi:hypothetical protein